MSDLAEKLEKRKSHLDELIAGAVEHFKSIEPLEVPVAFGERVVTVRMPFIWPKEFAELADGNPPRKGEQHGVPVYFSLAGVTRAMPNVSIIVDGEEDDLYVVRDRTAVYRWPELYDVLHPEDRQNLHTAVWGQYVWEPQQVHARIRQGAELKAQFEKREEVRNG